MGTEAFPSALGSQEALWEKPPSFSKPPVSRASGSFGAIGRERNHTGCTVRGYVRALYYRPRNSAFMLRATRRSDCIFRRREMVQFAGERTQTGKTSVFTRPPPAVRSSSPESNQVSLPRHSGFPCVVLRTQSPRPGTGARRARKRSSPRPAHGGAGPPAGYALLQCRQPVSRSLPVPLGPLRPRVPDTFRQDAAARNVGAGTVTLRNPRPGGWPPPTASPRPARPFTFPLAGSPGSGAAAMASGGRLRPAPPAPRAEAPSPASPAPARRPPF